MQLCISGTGGRAHPGESRTVRIGSYRFQVVPTCSNSIQGECQRMPTHTHQCSYAFQVLGAGHIQGNVLNLDLNV